MMSVALPFRCSLCTARIFAQMVADVVEPPPPPTIAPWRYRVCPPIGGPQRYNAVALPQSSPCCHRQVLAEVAVELQLAPTPGPLWPPGKIGKSITPMKKTMKAIVAKKGGKSITPMKKAMVAKKIRQEHHPHEDGNEGHGCEEGRKGDPSACGSSRHRWLK